MPYIKPHDRAEFDQEIKALLDVLDQQVHVAPGELNYIVSRIIWAQFDRKPSYTKANELVGVLECVKQEFIRRRLNAYEDEKISENGDLPTK